VAVAVDRTPSRALHPAHAFFLAATVPLFLGALLSDVAYGSTYQVQWINFASWLIVGALVFGAVALACALVGLRHADRRQAGYLLYCLLLLTAWVLGFINSLVHAKDAWASMPEGLVLSAIAAVLASAAAWMGFSGLRMEGAR
jgi:uncharacterized membrane protein